MAVFHIKRGTGQGGRLILNPETAARVRIACETVGGSEFVECFAAAEQAARSYVWGDHGEQDTNLLPDLLISLEAVHGVERGGLWEQTLQGPSGGGALAAGAALFWQNIPCDSEYAITFALPAKRIGGLMSKIEVCASANTRHLIVCADQQSDSVDYRATESAARGRTVTLKVVPGLHEAVQILAGRAEELESYLTALEADLSRTVWRSRSGRDSRN